MPDQRQRQKAGNLLPMTFDFADFDTALRQLDLDEAARLLESAADQDRAHLAHRIEEVREEAHAAANALATSINAFAMQHDHLALLRIDEDSATSRYLKLLSAAARQRAETHLRGARNWAERQRQANLRRLDEAQQALGDFDLGLAKSIVRRVEERFLDEDGQERRDQLLLDLSARAMETEELAEVAGQIYQEAQPQAKKWWRKRRS